MKPLRTLAIGGALPDAVEQVLGYNGAYSAFATSLDRVEAIALGLRLTLPSGLALVALAGWAATLSGPRPPIVLVAVVALPIEQLLASAGRAYHYYFLPWLPSMGVLAAYLCARLFTCFGARFSLVVLVACVSMAIVPSLLIGRLIAVSDDGAAREAARYIDSATTSADAFRLPVRGARDARLHVAREGGRARRGSRARSGCSSSTRQRTASSRRRLIAPGSPHGRRRSRSTCGRPRPHAS